MISNEYLVTSSSLKLYMACPRKYKHKMIDCLRKRDNGDGESRLNMDMGSYGHSFIEHNGAATDDVALSDVEAKLKMDALLVAYAEHYGEEAFYQDAQKEVLFCIPAKASGAQRAIRKFRIGGVIDAVSEDAVIDHKFLSRFSNSIADECASSPQRIYCVAANRNKMVFNLVRKPQHKFNPEKQTAVEYEQKIIDAIKADEEKNPMSYFWRYEFSTGDNQRVMDYFCERIGDIRSSMTTGVWPQFWTACVDGYGQTCPYFKICHAADPQFIIKEYFVSDESKRHEEIKRRQNNGKTGASTSTSAVDDTF